MTTKTISTLTLAGLLATFSACEGEPPKLPTNPPSTPAAEASAPSATETGTSVPGAPGASDPASAGASNCPCMGCAERAAMHGQPSPPSAGAEPSAGSAGATPANAMPAVAALPQDANGAAPVAVSGHAIAGTVSAVPARAAATAVVYLEDAGIVPKRGELAGVDNHGMSFGPYITVVAVGGRVVFSNSDPFPHNVFSPDNERFNLGTVQMKGSSAHTFKTKGVYSLLCNLHPNMLGYVVVSPSSYFAKTNAKGQFTIKDVPPGTYQITAWAPRLPTVTQPVTVKDADVTADFSLHR